MTPTVPLPPPHTVWTSCGQAYTAWGEGRVDFGSLVDGAIVLADGTRCPVAVIPPGGELAETGLPLWVLLLGLTLFLAGLVVIVFGRRRKEEPVGQHSWLGEDDIEPDVDDDELLTAVTGLGESKRLDEKAIATAATLDTEGWDLAGDRDRDPQAGHPWRDQ